MITRVGKKGGVAGKDESGDHDDGRYAANLCTFTVAGEPAQYNLRAFSRPAGVLKDVILRWGDSGNTALSSTLRL